MSVLQDTYNYFIGQGYTPNASAGIASGLYAESQLNPANVNPSSGAFGISQLLGGRQTSFYDEYGYQNTSLANQLQFVNEELPSNGYDAIQNASSPQAALSAFITRFERPAAGSETTGDIARGTRALGMIDMSGAPTGSNSIVTGAENLISSALGNFGAGADILSGKRVDAQGNTLYQDTASSIFQPVIDWFNGLIKGVEGGIQDTLARGGFAVLGIILLAAGVFILAANSKTVQGAVKTAALAA